MNVPANRVLHLSIDALTDNWDMYSVQFNVMDVGPMVRSYNFFAAQRLI